MIQEVAVKVYYTDNRFSFFNVDSLTTVAELEEAIAKKLGLTDSRPFGLFDASQRTATEFEECFLEKSQRVLDIVSVWNRIYWEGREAEGKKAVGISKNYFLYKVKFYYEIDLSENSTLELFYIQAINDVVGSRYPCTEQDSFALAALQAQGEFGM